MRKRSKTLAQNLAVYLGIVAVGGVNAWFWGKYVTGQKAAIAALEKDIKGLERERLTKESELSDADKKVTNYTEQIAERRRELDGYGEFLPPISTRPEVQKFILQTIEDLHIEIQKTEKVALTARPHYSKLDVRLSLKGTYRDFKLLLARIYKSERFIRVKEFQVLQHEDAEHKQSVSMAFETYFSNS